VFLAVNVHVSSTSTPEGRSRGSQLAASATLAAPCARTTNEAPVATATAIIITVSTSVRM
jgi:hypothetical protein